jgi:hypothetical protein
LSKTSTGGVHQIAASFFGLLPRANGGAGLPFARRGHSHPRIASERLGHSQVGITLDLDSRVLPGLQHEAAPRVTT